MTAQRSKRRAARKRHYQALARKRTQQALRKRERPDHLPAGLAVALGLAPAAGGPDDPASPTAPQADFGRGFKLHRKQEQE